MHFYSAESKIEWNYTVDTYLNALGLAYGLLATLNTVIAWFIKGYTNFSADIEIAADWGFTENFSTFRMYLMKDNWLSMILPFYGW